MAEDIAKRIEAEALEIERKKRELQV